MRHAEHLGDMPDRRLRQPAAVLLLRPPQQRNDRRLLAAFRIFLDLLLRPCGILRREGKILRLQVRRSKAANGHSRLSSHLMVRQLDVSPVCT